MSLLHLHIYFSLNIRLSICMRWLWQTRILAFLCSTVCPCACFFLPHPGCLQAIAGYRHKSRCYECPEHPSSLICPISSAFKAMKATTLKKKLFRGSWYLKWSCCVTGYMLLNPFCPVRRLKWPHTFPKITPSEFRNFNCALKWS